LQKRKALVWINEQKAIRKKTLEHTTERKEEYGFYLSVQSSNAQRVSTITHTNNKEKVGKKKKLEKRKTF